MVESFVPKTRCIPWSAFSLSMSEQLDRIHAKAEEALIINRTFAEGVACKEALKPAGFMPPDKRAKIIKLLEEISALSQTKEQHGS